MSKPVVYVKPLPEQGDGVYGIFNERDDVIEDSPWYTFLHTNSSDGTVSDSDLYGTVFALPECIDWREWSFIVFPGGMRIAL